MLNQYVEHLVIDKIEILVYQFDYTINGLVGLTLAVVCQRLIMLDFCIFRRQCPAFFQDFNRRVIILAPNLVPCESNHCGGISLVLLQALSVGRV